MLDTVGPRKLLTLSMLICTIFTFVFAITEHAFLAGVSRVISGLTMSFGYLGALVLVSRWLSIRYFALVVGLIQLLGSVGAIIGQQTVSQFVVRYGWRGAMSDVGVLGGVLTVLIWLIVRDYPKHKIPQKISFKQQAEQLWHLIKEVCNNVQT